MAVLSYVSTTPLDDPVKEDTKKGPVIWDGETHGPHNIWDCVLAPPEDQFKLENRLRNAYPGEMDICVNFKFVEGKLPDELVEAISTFMYSTMSLLNIQLKDYLKPAAPLQISKVLPNGGREFSNTTKVHCKAWLTLEATVIEDHLTTAADTIINSPGGHKLQIALELYAAHFNERQVRVRFILLVIAMEALSKKTYKHQVALDLLDSWKLELKAERDKYKEPDEEFYSLDDLYREIKWRGESSLGDGIRKLFAGLPGVTEEQRAHFQRRAMAVYRKRSTLVHEGYLPAGELPRLEEEARGLLEVLFVAAIEQAAAGKHT